MKESEKLILLMKLMILKMTINDINSINDIIKCVCSNDNNKILWLFNDYYWLLMW